LLTGICSNGRYVICKWAVCKMKPLTLAWLELTPYPPSAFPMAARRVVWLTPGWREE